MAPLRRRQSAFVAAAAAAAGTSVQAAAPSVSKTVGVAVGNEGGSERGRRTVGREKKSGEGVGEGRHRQEVYGRVG